MGSLFLVSSCCEQATAGMLRPFPVHFVQLQSNSTQSNVHDSHADTENCMEYGFLYETDCWLLVEIPKWLTDGSSVTFFGRWRGQCRYTLIGEITV